MKPLFTVRILLILLVLLVLLASKSYILMHFQIRKEGKLARTRSPLYRKLWSRATAHFLQNGTRYNEKQTENTESTKKPLFRQTQNRRAARAANHTRTRTSLQLLNTEESVKVYQFQVCPAKRHRSSWKLAYFHYTLRTINAPKLDPKLLDFEKLWPRQVLPRFLIWKCIKIFHTFVSARSRLYRPIFPFFLHFRVKYAPISP